MDNEIVNDKTYFKWDEMVLNLQWRTINHLNMSTYFVAWFSKIWLKFSEHINETSNILREFVASVAILQECKKYNTTNATVMRIKKTGFTEAVYEW